MKRIHFTAPAGAISAAASQFPQGTVMPLNAATEDALEGAKIGRLEAAEEPGKLEAVYLEHRVPAMLTVGRGSVESVLRSSSHEASAALHILGVSLHVGPCELEGELPLVPHETGLAVFHPEAVPLPVRLFVYGHRTGGRLEFGSGAVHAAIALVPRELPEGALEVHAAGERGAWFLRWPEEPAPARSASDAAPAA